MEIHGVVILYNPDETIIKNINSYINSLKKIYVVDNSEEKDISLICRIKEISDKCEYINSHGNKGIAHALNVGAKFAIENGADWLLTMDQDSSFVQGSLIKLIEWIENNASSNVGIIAPCHDINNNNIEDDKTIIHVDTVMTSGSLLNIKAYQKVGGFLDELFIDYVDNEYCLRLKINNYRILQLNNSVLKHSLGNIESFTLFNKTIYYTNHSHIRRYYIARNSLYVCNIYKKQFKDYYKKEQKRNIINIIKIIFLEKNKIKKIRFVLKGIIHFYKNQFGKLKND